MSRAIDIFKEILAIPRPSGKEEKIADYERQFNYFKFYFKVV